MKATDDIEDLRAYDRFRAAHDPARIAWLRKYYERRARIRAARAKAERDAARAENLALLKAANRAAAARGRRGA